MSSKERLIEFILKMTDEEAERVMSQLHQEQKHQEKQCK